MLFNLTLAYVVIYYSQLGGRVPLLGAMRIEFLTGAAILGGVALQALQSRADRPRDGSLTGPILALFGAMVISIPTSYWISHSIGTMVGVVKAFALYLMIVATVDSEEKLRRFLWVYVAMVGLITIEPLLGTVTGTAHISSERGYDRLYGTTGLWSHPNSLGGFAATNLGLLFFLFRGAKPRHAKIVLAAIAGASLVTIVLTGSRTAYVGVIGVAAGVWWLTGRSAMQLAAVAAALVVGWTVLPDQYRSHFLTLGQIDEVIAGEEKVEGSLAERWEIIEDAWAIFLTRPVTGVGVDAFPTARGAAFDRWQHTHNLYLQILTEIGIVGAAAFGLLLLRTVGNLRHVRAVGTGERAEAGWLAEAAAAVMALLWGRLVVGMFGMDLYENYWWFTAGLSVVLVRVARTKAGEPASHHGPAVIAGMSPALVGPPSAPVVLAPGLAATRLPNGSSAGRKADA